MTVISIPTRIAEPSAASAKAWRKSATVKATDTTQATRIEIPITANTTVSNVVATLKWLVTPRAACRSMSATSITIAAAVLHPTRRVSRGQPWR